jgi:hypothetical protein
MFSRIPTGAALVLVLGLSACGSSSAGTGVATAPTTTATTATGAAATGAAASSSAAKASMSAQEQGVAYAACMRKHGIDMPDPSKNGGPHINQNSGGSATQDLRKVNAAMAACKSLLPAGENLVKPPADSVAALRALAKCMRANGIPKFPDPGADGQLMIDKNSGIDPTSAAFKAAQTKCSKYAPTGGEQQGPGPAGGDSK